MVWNNSLENAAYGEADLRSELIEAYLKARENAAYLLAKIRVDFPNLTIHDISNADGLWQVASVIVKVHRMKVKRSEIYCEFQIRTGKTAYNKEV